MLVIIAEAELIFCTSVLKNVVHASIDDNRPRLFISGNHQHYTLIS